MSLFPMFLKLDGRSCLVVGGGKIGESKIRSLLTARARVRVVAPSVTRAVSRWAGAGILEWSARDFQPNDLAAAFLVIAATSSVDVNDFVYREARLRNVLCNVVDDPDRCDFYYPSLVRRGDLQIAISTGGSSPALAQRLRRDFEKQLAPVYAGWVDRLRKHRKELFARSLDPERRRALLHAAAGRQAFELGGTADHPAQEEITHER
jgi:precorrin-2 dehydrogenase/sirohydrochlorin ferrochelatase